MQTCVCVDGPLLLEYCGRMLRHAREQQGLTLEDMQARTGTSKSHIADIETGQTDASFSRIVRLAQALGVSLADVVPPEGPSVYAHIMLLIHARGPAFADRLQALLEVAPDCFRRRSE